MTKEQFLEKSKQLAVDFWTINLHDGTYESHFRKLLDEYEETKQCNIVNVSSRFSINKTILSDFALFAIIDNEEQKVVCHLVYDNGEKYCDEMANKMLVGLNGC